MPDYYRSNYQSYHNRTFHLDPASFLTPLVDSIPDGASLLDIGCGSGRDLRWLKQRGYRVTGLERVPELAALAEKAAGCRIIRADFEEFDFESLEVDAVLLVGALVHISHREMPRVLAAIIQALRPGGMALLTLKNGSGRHKDQDGRMFYLWDIEPLKKVFSDLGLQLKSSFSQPSLTGAADTWLTCLLERPERS